jgi:hypothetical protein
MEPGGQVPLTAIRAVGRQAPGGQTFGGGLRARLRLDLADGGVELFVVNRLDDVIRVITEGVTAAGRLRA